jgi:hypothetical protein
MDTIETAIIDLFTDLLHWPD